LTVTKPDQSNYKCPITRNLSLLFVPAIWNDAANKSELRGSEENHAIGARTSSWGLSSPHPRSRERGKKDPGNEVDGASAENHVPGWFWFYS